MSNNLRHRAMTIQHVVGSKHLLEALKRLRLPAYLQSALLAVVSNCGRQRTIK